jgi:hypothetical protein
VVIESVSNAVTQLTGCPTQAKNGLYGAPLVEIIPLRNPRCVGHPPGATAYTVGRFMYYGNAYLALPQGAQDTVRLHELKHTLFMGPHPAGYNYPLENNHITAVCGTGAPPAVN